jgi:general secretion pathway protein H
MKKLKFFPSPFGFCLLDKRGFSLLELVVVLLLVGLSSIIVLPSVDKGLKNREVREAALKLAAAARGLRSKAVYENSLERLVVDQRANSYQASSGKNVLLSSEIRFMGIEGGEPLGDGLRQFLFFPNGSLLGGEIGLSNREGVAYAIRLDPLLGRVAVLKWQR